MRYLIRKGEGFKKYPYHKNGALGFFPYDAAGNEKTLYGFIGMSEIAMTQPFVDAYMELLAPQAFWQEMRHYIKKLNQEMISHGCHPLEGTYLTLAPKGQKGYGYCKITSDGELTCGNADEYRGCTFKYRPCGWFNPDTLKLHAFKSGKPFTASEIILLYCNL